MSGNPTRTSRRIDIRGRARHEAADANPPADDGLRRACGSE